MLTFTKVGMLCCSRESAAQEIGFHADCFHWRPLTDGARAVRSPRSTCKGVDSRRLSAFEQNLSRRWKRRNGT